MLLFKRILNFKRDFLAKLRDKRRSRRYPVGPLFPLKASVNLLGQESGRPPSAPDRGSGYDWGGRLINLSNKGVCLQLLRAATTARGEQTNLRLSLEVHELLIPCVVAYFQTHSSYSLCGLSLKFTDFNSQKAYLQLLEAVSMGASFAHVKVAGMAPSRSGLVGEQYRAGNKALLTAWRSSPNRVLDSFELTMDTHCLRGGVDVSTLQVYRRARPAKVEASSDVDREVRRLFRWIVPNLPKVVPADLRRLLDHSANVRIAVAAGSTNSPKQWQPPDKKR